MIQHIISRVSIQLLLIYCHGGTSDCAHGKTYYFASHIAHDDEYNQPVDDIFQPLWYQQEPRNFEADEEDVERVNLVQEQMTDEQKLTNYLLRNYSSEVRPVVYANQSLSVVTRIYPMKILDLVEREQVLHMVLRFQLGWHDLRLSWSPGEFGNLTSIILPGDALWIPDIQTGNGANDRYGLLRNRDFPFKVHNDGEIWWHPTGSLFTRCSLDLLWFPFDFQRCPIVLESAMHSQSAVNLTVRPNKQTVVLTMYTENSLWDLAEATGTSFYYKSASAASARFWTPLNPVKFENNFTRVVFWLKLQRKTNYYKLNVLYPCFMLSTMQLLTFLLPLNSLTRVHQATTILLSVIIFQAVIADELPKTSHTISLMSVYTMLMIVISVVAIVESVFVANLLRRNFGPIKIPVQIAFMLRLFLKTPPASPDSKASLDRKISGDSLHQPGSRPSMDLLSAPRLDIVREESEEVSVNIEEEHSVCSVHLLTVPASPGGGSSSNNNSISYATTPRSSDDVTAAAAAEENALSEIQTPQMQDHLSALWRSATGRQPLETVVVNWTRIAFVVNAATFLLCVIFVVIIPMLMLCVIPTD